LIEKLNQVATASLQALDRLHSVGCVHTDVSLDSVVLSPSGSWKIGHLLQVKQQSTGGSGVIPRSALSGRLRPPEVLLGCSASELSDIFDLGLVLVEAANGTLLAPGEGSRPPTLFEELGALYQLIGPVPIKLAERSPGREAVCLPWGGYLRTLSQYFGCTMSWR